jgi:hypothetical protein
MSSALPEYKEDSDGRTILVTEPRNKVIVPDVSSLDWGEHQHLVTEQDVEQYKDGVSERRIVTVEGARQVDYWCLYCDYCNTPIPVGIYHYCLDCHLDMCPLCKLETSEEIALQNGAKSYAARKEKLTKCQRAHTVVPMDLIRAYPATCDGCGVDMQGGYCKRVEQDTFDMCTACWENPAFASEIEKHGGREAFTMNQASFMEATRFGSLNDWRPIISDGAQNYLLFNINADSPMCGKFAACAVDDHGRYAYFILDRITSAEDLALRISEYDKDIEWRASKDWTRHYNAPIPRLLASFGCQTHNG